MGFKGNELSNILAEYEDNKNGIILLRGIDKILEFNDIYNGLIQELISYINGTKINVSKNRKTRTIDTSNIIFMATGSCHRIQELLNANPSMVNNELIGRFLEKFYMKTLSKYTIC